VPASTKKENNQNQIERQNLRRDSITLLSLSSCEDLFERTWLVGVLFVESSNCF